MGLYEDWTRLAEEAQASDGGAKFWEDYFAAETAVYQKLLESRTTRVSGTLSALAAGYGMDETRFCGFLDGINTSLKEALELEKLSADSELAFDIDLEKLYYNMHAAKAPWLYGLAEWEGVLSEEKRREIAKEYRRACMFVRESEPGRNDPCPCGSGKKYKKCCGKNA